VNPSAGNDRIDWEALVALVLHPLKVSTLEALTYVGEPLSATDLQELVGADEEVDVAALEDHLQQLVDAGALEVTGERRGPGTAETLYFFAAPVS
jgi:hypothetical protein